MIWFSNWRYYSSRHNGLSPNVISGAKCNMVCLGKMALWGKMERGKMAPFHLTPKGVSFWPQCPGPFYHTPIAPTKISMPKMIKRFHEEEVINKPSGEYYPMNWIIIDFNNDLSPVKRHTTILIDTHVFTCVDIGKRYKEVLSTYKGFHRIKISPIKCRG